MDHVLNGIEVFYEVYLDEFLDEQVKHNYKSLTDNPVYLELRILIDSMNLYREFLKQPRLKLNQEVKAGLERRKL